MGQTWPSLRILTSIALLLLKVGCTAFRSFFFFFLLPSEYPFLQRCAFVWCSNLSNSPSKGYLTTEKPAVTRSLPLSLPRSGSSSTVVVFVTFSCLYLLHVEPHVQYLKMKFCSFGSRYAGTGWQLEKSTKFVFRYGSITVVNTAKKPQFRQMMGCWLWLGCFERFPSEVFVLRRFKGARYCCHTAAQVRQVLVMKIFKNV